jgi:hypothetical protein
MTMQVTNAGGSTDAPSQAAGCALPCGTVAITSEIIPRGVSVPHNPVRLVDERWAATSLPKPNGA